MIEKSYIWGTDLSGYMQDAGGVGGLLSMTEGGDNYFYVFDGNGNVTELVDTAGSVVANYEYSPFGKLISASGVDNTFRFSTKYEDAETGNLYYGYRYYSAEIGRWLNRDPIGEYGGKNLYGFINNNAIRYWDFLGLEKKCCELPTGVQGPEQQYETKTQCCHEGNVFLKSDRMTIQICIRPTQLFEGKVGDVIGNIIAGTIAGGEHAWLIVGNVAGGLGPVGTTGNPNPDPFDPFPEVEITDHTGQNQLPGSLCYNVAVDKCCILTNFKIGNQHGQCNPLTNNCQTSATGYIAQCGGDVKGVKKWIKTARLHYELSKGDSALGGEVPFTP